MNKKELIEMNKIKEEVNKRMVDELIQLSDMVETGVLSATAAKEVFKEWIRQPLFKTWRRLK